MAVPKKRRSKSKKRTRRACFKVNLPSFAKCSNCEALVHSHRACTQCGYYKGTQVIQFKEKTSSKKDA